MNSKMTLHNIMVAWRNLMKYKTQNVIAVLCLTVGMVCFCVTIIMSQRVQKQWKRTGCDPHSARVQLFTQGSRGDSVVYVTPEILRRINEAHLPSVGQIDINYWWLSSIASFIDLEGKEHLVDTKFGWVSPEHFNRLGLRSAITGKRIPVLKPGDMIMTKGMLERTFGLDVNPIGFKVDRMSRYGEENYRVIKDVVDTGDWMLTEDQMMVVTDMLKEYEQKEEEDTYMIHFDVVLPKGKKDTDLQKELQELLPEYKVSARTYSVNRQGLTLMVIIGCSVLLIGLLGFLKMQTQLFRLRWREMGLRRCMGATGSQLLWLLVCEVGIVFLFVTLLTLAFTSLLADFALPIIQKIYHFAFSFNMPRTYAAELWICLATFLVTAGIAALSVRKVVTTPLSEVVGKSRRNSSRGRSILIVMQMVICLLFAFFVAAGAYKVSGRDNSDYVEYFMSDNEDFAGCLVTENREWKVGFLDSVPQLQHIENYTSTVTLPLRQQDGDTAYTCQAMLTDEHLFEILNLEVRPSATEEEIDEDELTAIYVPTERAQQLRQTIGVAAAEHPRHRVIEKGKEAECVGYIRGKVFSSLMWQDERPVFLYVCERSYFAEHYLIDFRVVEDFENSLSWSLRHHIILKTTPGRYDEAVSELTDYYQRMGRYTLAKAPLDNLYDILFKEQRMMELVMQVGNIMTATALLCIVLTLFSSVSLDTRGRQKEVAIRKVHGASKRQIMWLFGKQYVWQLIVSSIITLLLCIALTELVYERNIIDSMSGVIPAYICSVLFIALVTLLTVGYKIYKVSKRPPIPLQGE